MRAWRLRFARKLALATTAALPLATWPGLERPFSTPKIWLLLGASCAILALALPSRPSRPSRPTWPAWLSSVWLASLVLPSLFGDVVSFDVLATAIAVGIWALALVAAQPRSRELAIAFAIGSSLVAAVAVLQWAEIDPFAAAGWEPRIRGASIRMRVYATLGNPNFVAALLAASAPLTVALLVAAEHVGARVLTSVSLAIQILALIATGSRGGVLGLLAAAFIWTIVRGRARTAVIVAAAIVAAGGIYYSRARDLRETLEGRIYVWSVASQGAFARPIVGSGPGAVEAFYLQWEKSLRSQQTPPVRSPYAGPQQNAHNDYLEVLVERGVPGLLALVAVIAVPLWIAIRAVNEELLDPLVPGAAASIAALAAVALVDFPLTRPESLAALWVAIVILAHALPPRVIQELRN